MGKETLTLEIDKSLMDRLRAAGIEPAAYLERLLKREAVLRESPAEFEDRAAAWSKKHREEIESYNQFVAEHGLLSDTLRVF